MFRRVIVLLISLVAIIAGLGGRNVKADPAGGSVATSAGDASFVLARMRYVDAGDAFSCVILDDASVKCFGLGADGQLGSGSTSNIGDGIGVAVSASAAIALGSGRTTRAIATGSSHACALLDNYSVKCWGSGIYGRLGYGDTTSRGTTSATMGDALVAVNLGTGRSAQMISAGGQHTCALLDDNTVKCWGRGANGQLGIGSTQTRGDEPGEMGDSAAAIALGSGLSARAIAAGTNHTCALLNDYTIKCWGDNSYGQLGQGSLASIGDGIGTAVSASPAIVLGSGRTARAIAAGDVHTCALLNDGSIKCWGAGSNGRLGSGATDDIGDGANEMGDALVPVSLGAGRTAIAITAGSSHTCALLDNYVVKCWGDGFDGKLGYGNQISIGDNPSEMGDALAAVPLGTGRSARAVVAVAAHTCAILDNDAVKCWGSGGSGRRGSGNTARVGNSSLTPVDAEPAIDLGGGHTANPLTEPGRPTSLVAIADDTQASLSWSAPTLNGGSSVIDYVIESSADSGTTWSTVNDGTSTAISATVSGLSNATNYIFRLSAVNDVATGAVSVASASVMPTAPTTTTTVAPTTISSPTTTTSTTTSSTSTTSTTISFLATPSTTTSSSTPTLSAERVAVRVIPRLVLQPFAPYATSLNAQQQRRLVKYSALLRRGDKVTCIGYATRSPLQMVSTLSVKRAETVCVYLAKRVRGITTTINTQLPTTVRTSSVSALAPLPSGSERQVMVFAVPHS